MSSPYVVDFGEIQIAPEVGGIRVRKGTGVLWPIRRTEGVVGEKPREPVKMPVYGVRAARMTLAAAAALIPEAMSGPAGQIGGSLDAY